MTRASTIVVDTPGALSAPGVETDSFEGIDPPAGVDASTRAPRARAKKRVPTIRGA